MLIYNTTYQVDDKDAENFIIWIHQVFMPKAQEGGLVSKARLTRILSHRNESGECFSLQFEVESSAILHKWYNSTGNVLNQEMLKVFDNNVVGFTTLMEVIEES
mgnify:FL=1